MKSVLFIAIELFFAAEFMYEDSFRLCVLHFRLFFYIFNKNVMKKNFTIIIPTVIWLCNHEMRRMWKSCQNKTNQI